MMAQSRAESTREINNYGSYINQFLPNIIKSIRQYERINKKICRQKMSIIFNEICINEEILPKYTYILLLRYVKWLTDFRGLPFSVEMPTSCLKHMNSVLSEFMPLSVCFKLFSYSSLTWASVFVRSIRSSAFVIVSVGYCLLFVSFSATPFSFVRSINIWFGLLGFMAYQP